MTEIYQPVGCRECRDSGYSGRIGVFELLRSDAVVRKLCIENASAGQIRDYGLRNGMTTLRQSGWGKVLEGVTSIEEVVRITKGDFLG
jgi:general secretion pathway protein E/type IV pilus assembly protein PilB